MARSLPVENLLPHNVGSIINYTCSNLLKQPNGELIVAVDHNQLRRMVSETVDPINWSHPPPSWAVPPEHHVLHGAMWATTSEDRLVATSEDRTRDLRYASPTHCLCGHSGYKVNALYLNNVHFTCILYDAPVCKEQLSTIRCTCTLYAVPVYCKLQL